MIGQFRKFTSEVSVELKKVSWSTRRELLDSTWIVMITALCLGGFIGFIDLVLSKFIGALIK